MAQRLHAPPATMPVGHFSALVALAVSSALFISAGCLQSPTTTPDADDTALPSLARARGTEPIGVAQEPMGHIEQWYGSKDFPFVVQVEDDGQDPAGGWQRSVTSLSFTVWHGIEGVYNWECPIEIGMPIRSQAQGKITASHASLWTTQVANDVAPLLAESRPADEWIGRGSTFCDELRERMQETLNNRHQNLGARVKRP
jgi:hypothetical protein